MEEGEVVREGGKGGMTWLGRDKKRKLESVHGGMVTRSGMGASAGVCFCRHDFGKQPRRGVEGHARTFLGLGDKGGACGEG